MLIRIKQNKNIFIPLWWSHNRQIVFNKSIDLILHSIERLNLLNKVSYTDVKLTCMFYTALPCTVPWQRNKQAY